MWRLSQLLKPRYMLQHVVADCAVRDVLIVRVLCNNATNGTKCAILVFGASARGARWADTRSPRQALASSNSSNSSNDNDNNNNNHSSNTTTTTTNNNTNNKK